LAIWVGVNLLFLILQFLKLEILLLICTSFGGAYIRALSFNSRQELLQKVARVNCYMRNNLNQDLNLESIASFAGYSHYHFQRQYKLATGLSPTKQLRIWRLEAALEHLKLNDLQLSAIADLVGYNDLPTFSKAFKQHYGQSPSKYLKNIDK
jgi:AraC-like DNA-binding protein